MHASDLPEDPDLSIPTLPVICDKCRATGMAGDEAFSAIPELLEFTPVPRRARADGWREEHQRAFIAALAITGSPKQAARAIGKHQFGADQLRNARGGKSFAAAWDAAIDLARERETMRIHDNLAELAERREAELAQLTQLGAHPEPVEGPYRPLLPATGDFPPGYDPEFDDDERLEYLTAEQQVRERMLAARRLLLFIYATDDDPESGPARRQAWETLCGPVNWQRAARNQPEGGEANAMRHARDPDVLVTAEVGFLSDLTGGEDTMTPLIMEALRLHGESTEASATDGEADASR